MITRKIQQDGIVQLQGESGKDFSHHSFIKYIESNKSEQKQSQMAQKLQTTFLKICDGKYKLDILKQLASKFRGTHIPINYKQSFSFSQNWQEKSKIKQERNSNLLQLTSKMGYFISIIIMFQRLILVWQLSLYRMFQFQNLVYMFIAAIFGIMVDLIFKIYLLNQQLNKKTQLKTLVNQLCNKHVIELFYSDFISLFYFISMVIYNKTEPSLVNTFLIICDMVLAILNAFRFSELYSNLILILVKQKYRIYLGIFDFVCKLVILLHIFAIILYIPPLIEQKNNWLASVENYKDLQWLPRYLYCVYFASTTLLTVGYGDFLPKNYMQIIFIILTQITGIILVGYIINETGRLLSQVRISIQQFENDLLTTQKIGNNFNLSSDLKRRMKNDIVNNRIASEELIVQRENNLLLKLNQDLRNEVNSENHMQIVKTSLFFICNWSKRIHTEIAKVLVKVVIPVNEKIFCKDKVYMLTKGKFDIFTERRFGTKVFCKRFLKQLQKKMTNEVHQNCFGYTSLVVGKPCRLTAIAKDFNICYTFEHSEFEDFLKNSRTDFEYYHRLKANLLNQQFPQKLQCSQIINNRQNYYPVKYYLVKKYKKFSKNQERKDKYERRHNRCSLIFEEVQPMPMTIEQLQDAVIETQKQIQFDENEGQNQDKQQSQKNLMKKSIDYINLKKRTLIVAQSQKFQNIRNCIAPRSYEKRYFSNNKYIQRNRQQAAKNIIKLNIVETSFFEITKQYERYFPKANRSMILKKLNNSSIEKKETKKQNILSLFENSNAKMRRNSFQPQFCSM